jgi:hypothetical protein
VESFDSRKAACSKKTRRMTLTQNALAASFANVDFPLLFKRWASANVTGIPSLGFCVAMDVGHALRVPGPLGDFVLFATSKVVQAMRSGK